MTKISKKVAIMGLIAIIAIGTTLGTASAIESLPSPSNLIEIVDKINEMITEYDTRVAAIENAIDGIHQHSFVRADFILGEVVNNEQNIVFCEPGELATGGGYGLFDPGLRAIVIQPESQSYSITVTGTATVSGANMAVFVTCLPLP